MVFDKMYGVEWCRREGFRQGSECGRLIGSDEGREGDEEGFCSPRRHSPAVAGVWQGDGATPLLMASQLGHDEVVMELLTAGADPAQPRVRELAALAGGACRMPTTGPSPPYPDPYP